MSNSKDIPNAYKKNIYQRQEIKEEHRKIKLLYDKIVTGDIPKIINIYSLVFKNIHPDKKAVVNITDFDSDNYTEEYKPNERFRKLFLNRDGFSLSNAFNLNREKEEMDAIRTSYINTFPYRGFIKMLRRLFEHKDEIVNAIDKEYKKSVAIRFFKAFEESGCNEFFDYTQDFDFLKEIKSLEVEHYEEDKMQKIKINFFLYRNAGKSISVDTDNCSHWTRNISIDLDDLEKCSQIFDEIMAFLNKYYNHLKIQEESLIKFKGLLEESFSKELILNSLKT